MDFFEGDLPLVVALFAVHGDHRVECGAVGESELGGVLDGFVELLVAVHQQVAAHFGVGRREVERQAVGLGVPVGRAAVLLAGESFRADIEARIHARKRLKQVKDVEANPLLGGIVAVNHNVGKVPLGAPGLALLGEQGFVARRTGRCGLGRRTRLDLSGRSVHRRNHTHVLVQGDSLACGGLDGEYLRSVAFAAYGRSAPAIHTALHGCRHKKVELLGARLDPRTCAVALLRPKRLVPVGVRIHHVKIQVGLEHHLGGAVDRHPELLGRNLVAHNAQEALCFDGHGGSVGERSGESAGEDAVLHIELAVKIRNRGRVQIDHFAVDAQVDAHVVHGVQDLGEVFRVAVLPPTHLGLVGVVHPSDVAAVEVLAAKGLFVVGAVAHASVAERKKALAHDVGFGRPGRFDDAPGIDVNGGLHSELLVASYGLKLQGLFRRQLVQAADK